MSSVKPLGFQRQTMKILYVTTLVLLGALAGATTFTGSRFSLADAASSKTGYASSLVNVTDVRTIASIGSSAPRNLSHSSLGANAAAGGSNSEVSAFSGSSSTGTSTSGPLGHGGGGPSHGAGGPGSHDPGFGSGPGSGPGCGASPNAVPEPASIAALGVGVLTMIRRKQKERNR